MRSRSISAFPLPPEFRSAAADTSAPGAPVRAQQKSGLSPTEDCVRLRPLKYSQPLLQMQAAEDSCRCKVRMSGLRKVGMSAFMGGRGPHGNGAHSIESTRTGPLESVAGRGAG